MFRITIPTRHAAVVYHAGRLVDVLPAGRTRRRWGHHYVLVDLRERQQVIPPQDIPTADGLGVRVSAVARWAITDPVAFLEVSQTPADTLHLATQLALREAVGALAAADLVVALRRLDVTAPVDAATRQVGIATLGVAVRDVVLPHDLRIATAEVVTARCGAQPRLRRPAPRPRPCGRWPTGPGCSTSTRRWLSCASSSPRRPALAWCCSWAERRSRRATDHARRSPVVGDWRPAGYAARTQCARGIPGPGRGQETKERAFAGERVSMLRPRFWWSSISAAHPIIRPKRNTVKAAFSN
jgi:hypothetical protein